MKPIYRHTQTNVLFPLLFAAAALLVVVYLPLPSNAIVMGALVLFGFLAFTFYSLTVSVDHEYIRCWFGPGWIRRTIAIEDVRDVEAVRNHWVYGWGIRWIGTGWMFNIAGLDAVEVVLVDGGRFRIGTDEPRELEAAIWSGMPLAE